MKIRQAKFSDLNIISDLNLKLFIFEREFAKTYSLKWTHSQVGQDYFKKRIIGENGIVLVAVENKLRVGYICGYNYTFKARSEPQMAEIDNMFIEESWRGKGVGKKLVEAFETEAKKRGVKRVKVGALYKNHLAQKFYRSLGYHEHEVVLEKEI